MESIQTMALSSRFYCDKNHGYSMDYICEFSIKNFYEGTIRHITTVLNYCANYNMSFCTQATMNKPDGT